MKVVAQLFQMEGVEASLIADLDLDRARYAYTASQVPEDEIVAVESLLEASQAVYDGQPAVTQDGLLLTQVDLIDVVVEATGIFRDGKKAAVHREVGGVAAAGKARRVLPVEAAEAAAGDSIARAWETARM